MEEVGFSRGHMKKMDLREGAPSAEVERLQEPELTTVSECWDTKTSCLEEEEEEELPSLLPSPSFFSS